jgi:hypothetical protein
MTATWRLLLLQKEHPVSAAQRRACREACALLQTANPPSEPSPSKRAGRLIVRRVMFSALLCRTDCFFGAAWGCGVPCREPAPPLMSVGSKASHVRSSSSPSAPRHQTRCHAFGHAHGHVPEHCCAQGTLRRGMQGACSTGSSPSYLRART